MIILVTHSAKFSCNFTFWLLPFQNSNMAANSTENWKQDVTSDSQLRLQSLLFTNIFVVEARNTTFIPIPWCMLHRMPQHVKQLSSSISTWTANCEQGLRDSYQVIFQRNQYKGIYFTVSCITRSTFHQFQFKIGENLVTVALLKCV